MDDAATTSNEIVGVLTRAMAAVEQRKTLSGPEKREAVIALVTRFVDEVPGDGGAALQASVRFLLPPLIDAIVAASRGQLDINRAAAGCRSGCRSCCIS